MKFHFTKVSILYATMYIVAWSAAGKVALPKLISDGMVLQRDISVRIWGWADPGERVMVTINGKQYRASADVNSQWSITLKSMKAGGPFKMVVQGQDSRIELHDIYVGDVWFCSGQSNMVTKMERVKEKYPEFITEANYPEIRNFLVPTKGDVTQQHEDFSEGSWTAITPQSVMNVGAVSYFFARQLYKKYHVPIGIINASVGGKPIEAWISEDGFKSFPRYVEAVHQYHDTVFMNNVYRQANQNKQVTMKEDDAGTMGPVPWYDPSFQPKAWHNFWLPGYWDDQGVRGLHGILWFKKEIEVPSTFVGKPAKLFLGCIVDADQTYVNGKLVGNITYRYPPRRYELAPGVLKAGKNIIVIRVTNTSDKGGFVPDKSYCIKTADETLDLRGDWQYEVGQAFAPRTDVKNYTPFSPEDSPTGLFNAMAKPATFYTIKGFLWYQGESNTGRADEYEGLLKSLIGDWRLKWKEGDLPFLYVQLPNFLERQYFPSESQWAQLRDAQRRCLAVANTAMVTTIDVGEWNDIHPLSKKDIGERLSMAASALAYSDKNEYMGPLYESCRKMSDGKILISFTHLGAGLTTNDGATPKYFAVAGDDRKFVWANASIEGNDLIVTCDAISSPRYVRYAWADNPEGANLCNKEGLLASPFEATIDK